MPLVVFSFNGSAAFESTGKGEGGGGGAYLKREGNGRIMRVAMIDRIEMRSWKH